MKSPLDLETQRIRQNAWIKQKLHEWQGEWHKVFDRDPVLCAIDEFERPDQLPENIQSDYRLIFVLSRAIRESRRSCFALFPEGAEMQRRFEIFLTEDVTPLKEAAAHDLALQIAQHAINANPDVDVDWDKIDFIDSNNIDAQELLSRTDDISYLFERNLLKPVAETELPSVAAELFLTEPLYASAGNDYQLRDWITAAMFDMNLDKIYEMTYRLWRSGWRLRIAVEGFVLIRDQ
ncbi:hypothetical protein [Agrobacterium sp. SUL3]|uniref:hypothetical protein n=1 Tax=Agrobacterium sp. SUL3 TaxID=1701910 RepID=UPI00069A031F|nr:hypothetical protein [Agrobacterium sp. SUL3]KNY31162.1 hypothetical protein AKG12_26130 [Agrobacterium sp. SUL3]